VLLVLGVPIAWFSAAFILRHQPKVSLVLKNTGVAALLAFEVGYGGLLMYYLYRKGWRLRDVSLPPERKDVLRAVGVCFLSYVVSAVGTLLARAFFEVEGFAVVSQVNVPIAVLAALINPFFEEALWLAYITHGPGRDRPALTAALSLGGRMLSHAYQGWATIYSIAPLGAYYLLYYRRTGRLVPVVFAHGVLDLLGFILLRGGGVVG
jgi:membrane protease YdiL (CAAX protease family)